MDKLIGMPRGIVGSERGGVLTNELRDNAVLGSAAGRDREGKPERAESLPPGVRRRVAHRRPRQASVSVGRDRHHDFEHRVGHFRKLTNPLGFGSGAIPTGQIRTEIDRELERRFSPEFRNRIDVSSCSNP